MNATDFNRREFLKRLGFAAGTAVFISSDLHAEDEKPPQKVDIERYKDKSVTEAGKKLNILFLGGTRFLGPPAIQYALERGHHVTMLNRGISNPHLFRKVHRIKADRLEGLSNAESELKKQKWDVVIDTWQGNPMVVKQAAELLASHATRYVYASSIAVYGRQNYDKNPEVFEDMSLPEPAQVPATLKEEVKDYRTRKQLAEQYVTTSFGDRTSITRFHNIIGFYMEPGSEGQIYWPIRFQRGGDILLPGDGKDRMQTIDVKDAARWLVRCAENNINGTFNAGRRYSWTDYAGACRSLSDKTCIAHWTELEKLQAQKVRVNSDMPYYIPRTMGPGFFNISDAKAMAQGIYYRPLSATLTDVIGGFYHHYAADYEFGPPNCQAGISLHREKEILTNLGAI